jgi:hypothetical protein
VTLLTELAPGPSAGRLSFVPFHYPRALAQLNQFDLCACDHEQRGFGMTLLSASFLLDGVPFEH